MRASITYGGSRRRAISTRQVCASGWPTSDSRVVGLVRSKTRWLSKVRISRMPRVIVTRGPGRVRARAQVASAPTAQAMRISTVTRLASANTTAAAASRVSTSRPHGAPRTALPCWRTGVNATSGPTRAGSAGSRRVGVEVAGDGGWKGGGGGNAGGGGSAVGGAWYGGGAWNGGGWWAGGGGTSGWSVIPMTAL